jgi:hypothetical protein
VDGVGATLRRARNRRKIDLSEVEATTKIRIRYLQAIEAEEWGALPGETYACGFIRTYASYLGLDGARLADEHRRASGVERPADRLPHAEPSGARTGRRRRGPRVPPRVLAAIVSAVLVAALIAVGLSSGGAPTAVPPVRTEKSHPQPAAGQHAERPTTPPQGLSLRLTTTAEVWICLLDAVGEPLVDGQILAAGSEAGPFRSGSFTVSFGNGEVSMTVNGQQATIPATSSPIGYAIGAGGQMRELSEGERPTCT